jgi:predicted dehydrogenase
MTAPFRIGVVGLGFGQQAHVPAFRRDGRCEVVAICGSDQARAGRVAESLGIPKAYGDWRELIADTEIDVVAIAVPPLLQAAIAIEAARLGKAVFCEKPLAANVDDALRMCQAVTDHQVAHAIDFLFPESEAFLLAKGEISAGRLGEVRHALVSWKVETYAVRNRLESWKF